MKNFILFIGTIFLILVLIECEEPDKNITYVRTELGGCNGQDFNDFKSAGEEQEDTVIFTIYKDTLDIYVGINYICCAPFTPESIISNDSIIMTLNDTCSNPYITCYCRCMCYYTFDFLFVDFEEKEYFFKIILNDPREENPTIFREGKIDLSTKN